ncbi:unnamed protein product [Calypogeia fissa]
MAYSKVGRVRHSESGNLLWALRGLCLPPLVISGRWGGRGGLKAACTLIGAGVVGAVLALRYSPNSIFASKFSSTSSANPAHSSKEAIGTLKEEELTVPGLQNAGNNCFLNVILQALASSRAFVNFTAACAEVTSKSQTKSLVTYDNDTVSMPLAVSVSSLMKELSQLGGPYRTSSPRRVMLELRSYVKHFDLASQQDAAEALVHLASAIQEERDNYIQWLKPTFQTFATAPSVFDQGFSTVSKEGFKHRKGGDKLLESWRGNLHWPLEGTLASSLTCQRCAHQYTTQIQFFNDISLSPLQDKGGNIIQGCTLENCLEKFTGPEWIDDVKCSNCSHEAAVVSIYSVFQDSMIRTPRSHDREEHARGLRNTLQMTEECGCNGDCDCEELVRQHGGNWTDVHANASKQLKIGRSPEVVCFQLQRVVIGEDGALKKLTGHVAFPRVLDLFPFTAAAESSVRDNGTMKTEKQSLLWKGLQQGIRLSNEEKLCVSGEGSICETDSAYNGGRDSDTQTNSSPAETPCFPQEEPPEISLTSTIGSPISLNSLNTDSVNETTGKDSEKLSEVGGELLVSEQASQRTEVPFEDFNSISPILASNSGSYRTYSPLVSSISSPYVPRMFPRQLQALSLITSHDGEQFCMSAMSNPPKSPNRSITKTSKYSRRLLYELVSVVVHQGGPQSGHYIVYRKMIQSNCSQEHEVLENDLQLQDITQAIDLSVHNYGEGAAGVNNHRLENVGTTDEVVPLWFRVSDTHVERVPEQEVFSARATLLFYEQLRSS